MKNQAVASSSKDKLPKVHVSNQSTKSAKAWLHFTGQSGKNAKEDMRNYDVWYDVTILEYIVHQLNSFYLAAYMCEIPKNFTQELTCLNQLKIQLQKPIGFISYEPGTTETPHFIVGLLTLENQLLIINPTGPTKHREFYQTLSSIKQDLKLDVYLADNILQKDEEGIVSCGPICAEIIRHWLNFSELLDIKSTLLSEKQEDKEGLIYYSVDVSKLLPNKLLTIEGDFSELMQGLRREHAETLKPTSDTENDNKYWDEQCENAPIQRVIRRMLNNEINLFNLEASEEYQLLQQKLIQPLAWITKVLDAAHLPHLGLPVKWYKGTEREHTKMAYDPDKKQAYNLTKDKVSRAGLDFITSTSGKNAMPGTKAPASARFERFQEDELQRNLVKDDEGNVLVPCLVHGDYVKVESLQTDHLQAKEQILKRQKELVELLNEKPEFGKFVMSLEGMNKFFVKTPFPTKLDRKGNITEYGPEKIYGTFFFYELYFNDIDNLWLICQACNLHKGNKDTIEWLSNQWMYGKDFLNSLKKIYTKSANKEIEERKTILEKVNTNEGLATVAIKWFWENHSTFISNAKEFYEDLQLPFKILNKQVDVEFRQGEVQKAEIFQASLQAREQLASTVLNMPNLDMSASDNTTVTGKKPLIVTDQQSHKISYNIEQYSNMIDEVAEELPEMIEQRAKNKLQEKISGKRNEHPNTSEEFEETKEKKYKLS